MYMTTAVEFFCPSCKFIIKGDMPECPRCGAKLIYGERGIKTTIPVINGFNESAPAEETFIDESLIPEVGIALYKREGNILIAYCADNEFTIGRQEEDASDRQDEINHIDLTPVGGYEFGVSRKHALIRLTGYGYEIIDLKSSNGTWVNGKRLIPGKPTPLQSGAVIRLGHMNLVAVYN